MRLPKSVQADLALVLVTVIWGSTFTIVKSALAQVSPMLFIALRFWIASLVCIPFTARTLRKIPPETLRRGAILAVLLLGGFIFQTLGLQGSTPSKSAFITALSVLLVPIFGFLLFKHRPRIQTGIGILLATVGLGFLTLDRLELSFSYGDTLTLICAVFFALHILFVGRYSPVSDYRQLVVLQVTICAVAGSVATPIFDHPPFLVWDVRCSFYLIITGVLATALGFYVQNSAQRFTTPNRTALIFSLEPVFAALFAYLILGHTPTAKEWIGGALILSGILLSQLRRD